MIEITIPGKGEVCLKHLVLDVNGTLAIDGQLIDGVIKRIAAIRQKLNVYLLTANTHGNIGRIEDYLNLKANLLANGNEAEQKALFVESLGKENVAVIGQGANDALMLKTACIGICVLSEEGTSRDALDACDLFLPNINTALDLFEYPLRLIASLRK